MKKKTINLLYDLQLSVLNSMDDGRFLITTDSNVNYGTYLIKNLLEQNEDLNVYVLVPPLEKTLVSVSEERLLENFKDRVTLVDYDYFGNPFVDRMTFNSQKMFKELEGIDIDIVYTNDPCKVLPFKTFFYYKQKKMIPVMSRNHWVTGSTDRKVPEEIDFQLRQIEGALVGDDMSFNSQYAAAIFTMDSMDVVTESVATEVSNRLSVYEAVDIDKVDRHKTDEKLEKFTILWAHRLSYYTGWKETFEALNELWKKRQDFQVIIPDPGDKSTQQELKSQYPFMKMIDKDSWTHQSYLETCWKVDLCLGNHKYPATWGGLAITEPMVAETVPLMPNRYAYIEMFYSDYKHPIFFSDEAGMIKNIEYYLDNREALEEAKKDSRKFCLENLNPKELARKVNKKILELCTSY